MSIYKVEKYFGHDRGYSCAFRQWGANQIVAYCMVIV